MNEEDLVTPEWYRALGDIGLGQVGDVLCERCKRRRGQHYSGRCYAGEGVVSKRFFVLHRTDPAVNLQPGQTVEEVRRGYVQREDGSWVRFIRSENELDLRGDDARQRMEARAEVAKKRLAEAAAKPEVRAEFYLCAPGCDPANPCMSEEVSHAWNIDDVPCLARRHLREEEAISWDNRSEGVADPVAKVKSPMVPGVRWNGRAWRH